MKDIDLREYVRGYENLVNLLKENIIRAEKAGWKKKDYGRLKRVGNSFGEVYLMLYKGGGEVVFANINGRWMMKNVEYDVEYKNYHEQFTIISEHALERYRCRKNMWASPILKVLYDIQENYVNAKFGANDRFEGGYAVAKDGSLFVLETETCTVKKRTAVIRLVKTILDQPDRKIDRATKEVNEMVGDYGDQVVWIDDNGKTYVYESAAA